MNRNLESLFKRVGNLFLLSSLVVAPYVASARSPISVVEHTYDPSLSENIDEDDEKEKIFAVDIVTTYDDGDKKIVYEIRTKDDPGFYKESIETHYKTLDERPTEIKYEDLDKDGNKDIVYFMLLDLFERSDRGYRYERWCLPGLGDGKFGTPTQKGGVDSY